jgi:hypothetical protein
MGNTGDRAVKGIVAQSTPASQEAGPTFNMNLAVITSDDQGNVNTSEWMHAWWGHACGCGEDKKG